MRSGAARGCAGGGSMRHVAGCERGVPRRAWPSMRRARRVAPRDVTPQRRLLRCDGLRVIAHALACPSLPRCSLTSLQIFTPSLLRVSSRVCSVPSQPPPGRRRRRPQRSRRSACSSGRAASPPQPAPQRQSSPKTRAYSSCWRWRSGRRTRRRQRRQRLWLRAAPAAALQPRCAGRLGLPLLRLPAPPPALPLASPPRRLAAPAPPLLPRLQLHLLRQAPPAPPLSLCPPSSGPLRRLLPLPLHQRQQQPPLPRPPCPTGWSTQPCWRRRSCTCSRCT